MAVAGESLLASGVLIKDHNSLTGLRHPWSGFRREGGDEFEISLDNNKPGV